MKMNWAGGIIRKRETIDNWIVGRGIKHSRGQVALPPKEEVPGCPERGVLRNGNERKILGRVGGEGNSRPFRRQVGVLSSSEMVIGRASRGVYFS